MWETREQRMAHEDISLHALLPRARDSSERLTLASGATTPTLVLGFTLANAPISSIGRVCIAYGPTRPLSRKNVPNKRQSTTVMMRLFFSIHLRKEPSTSEARCGTDA
jgi:hypothetical protein